jgi:hypothetical protein
MAAPRHNSKVRCVDMGKGSSRPGVSKQSGILQDADGDVGKGGQTYANMLGAAPGRGMAGAAAEMSGQRSRGTFGLRRHMGRACQAHSMDLGRIKYTPWTSGQRCGGHKVAPANQNILEKHTFSRSASSPGHKAFRRLRAPPPANMRRESHAP